MRLWRISNYADLKGVGGLETAGRWHHKGHPVVYLSEHPALAMLEVLANLELDLGDLPETYQLLAVEADAALSLALALADLPEDWKTNEDATRAIGTEWLTSRDSALLRVPSVLIPHAHNYLLNPNHVDVAKIRIEFATPYPWDKRLLER